MALVVTHSYRNPFTQNVVYYIILLALVGAKVSWVRAGEGMSYARVARDSIRKERNNRAWGLLRSCSTCSYCDESCVVALSSRREVQ